MMRAFVPIGLLAFAVGLVLLVTAIRHQQAIFVVEILRFEGSSIKGPPDPVTIFRMNALKDEVKGWLRRRVTLEDAKGLP